MNPDTLFQYGNIAALAGWAALLASPLIPALAERLSAFIIPTLLSIAYAGLILAFWSGAPGGFATLDAAVRLFDSREIVLAGWLHYLAFDLFAGAWEVRTAREANIPFLLVVPCLVLTFLFGPAGFLLFLMIRAVHAPAIRA
jgi:hypothetical protein